MIRSVAVYESTCLDPYRNLAVEEHLLETAAEGRCILYLWQNAHTVVIGRNQNPWKECRTALLEEEGGVLARRLSGGGAVYHNLGNLNFTFLLRREDFDVERQLAVILRALKELGITAEKSGRNDLTVQGRKFSGNAFYKHDGKACHHGTLMVDVDTEKLTRYLSPSKAKLQAKGVDSVRSRVINLTEVLPGLTVAKLKDALRNAFAAEYGCRPEMLTQDALDGARIDTLTARNRSWAWNFGQKLPFTLACGARFSWGEVQVCLDVQEGVIRRTQIFSDAMDAAVIPQWEARLTGCPMTRSALAQALHREDPREQELRRLLQQQLD